MFSYTYICQVYTHIHTCKYTTSHNILYSLAAKLWQIRVMVDTTPYIETPYANRWGSVYCSVDISLTVPYLGPKLRAAVR